jgi:hypothetical protein
MPEFGLLSAIVVFSLVANVVLSKLAAPRKLKNPGAFILLNSFPNAGFLGLPLCAAVWGGVGLAYASVYTLFATLVHFTLGVFASLQTKLKGISQPLKATGKFPVVWIMLAILFILAAGIELPTPILGIFGLVGQLTLYLAIFYVGLCIRITRRAPVYECLYVGLFRFFVSPILILIPLILFRIDGWQILAFEAAMPPAVINTVIASYYRLGKELTANITAILSICFLAVFFVLYPLLTIS